MDTQARLDQGQAARHLGVNEKQFYRWVALKEVPEPTVTVPKRRRKYYLVSDLPVLRAAVEAHRRRVAALFGLTWPA